MIRTYKKTELPDGTIVVESHGPVSRAWRGARIAWAVIILLTALVAACEGQWSTSGFALLVGAIVLPTMRRTGHRTGCLE